MSVRRTPLVALLERVHPGPSASRYWDKSNYESFEAQEEAARTSSTCYIGNLSYYTSEEQIHEFFREAGAIKRVIMGIHRVEKTPCGFAFVEFVARASAEIAEACLNGKLLDSRRIKVDIDPGFKELRQFGRGRGGGQVRDDFREDVDEDRGGLGALAKAGIHPSANRDSSSGNYSSRKRPSPYSGHQGGGRQRRGRFDGGEARFGGGETAPPPPLGEVTMSVEGAGAPAMNMSVPPPLLAPPHGNFADKYPPPPLAYPAASYPPPLPPPREYAGRYDERDGRGRDYHHPRQYQGPPPNFYPPNGGQFVPPPAFPARPTVDEFGRDIGGGAAAVASAAATAEGGRTGGSSRRRREEDDE